MFYVDVVLDEIIAEALRQKASDVHWQAQGEQVVVRIRRGGLLYTYRVLAKTEGEKIINRVKVLSGLDISEKRLPQDGRWVWQARDAMVTLRVATIPSLNGESIVCRLLQQENNHKTLGALGMPASLQADIGLLVKRAQGLFLVCGPTGSGKTATLYALLRLLDAAHEHILTLEDPIEAELPYVSQIAVNERVGLTFARGLRSILRLDPDTIMVGEIRDIETAQLAVQAALTGHRVLATLHTDNAADCVIRLQNMGIAPYLLEATLIGAVAQRLARRCDVEGERLGLFELWCPPLQEKWTIAQAAKFVVSDLTQAGRRALASQMVTTEELQRIGVYP